MNINNKAYDNNIMYYVYDLCGQVNVNAQYSLQYKYDTWYASTIKEV